VSYKYCRAALGSIVRVVCPVQSIICYIQIRSVCKEIFRNQCYIRLSCSSMSSSSLWGTKPLAFQRRIVRERWVFWFI
jgi:hypothetical protein